jgi:hypothetical protein
MPFKPPPMTPSCLISLHAEAVSFTGFTISLSSMPLYSQASLTAALVINGGRCAIIPTKRRLKIREGNAVQESLLAGSEDIGRERHLILIVHQLKIVDEPSE